jgi:hypothetical protein
MFTNAYFSYEHLILVHDMLAANGGCRICAWLDVSVHLRRKIPLDSSTAYCTMLFYELSTSGPHM